jgi:putative colanic acid biosynthesis UDP-glucose lipid carrier transferase
MRRYASITSVLAPLLDVALVVIVGVGSYDVRFGRSGMFLPFSYEMLVAFVALLLVFVFRETKIYQSWRATGMVANVGQMLSACGLTFASALVILALGHEDAIYSRWWLLLWFVSTVVALVAERTAIHMVLRLVRERGYNHKHVIVVGCGPRAHELIQRTRSAPEAGFKVIGVFVDDPQMAPVCDLTVRPLTEVGLFLQTNPVAEIWIAVPLEKSELVTRLLTQIPPHTANIRYAPDLAGLFLLNHGVSEVLHVPMLDILVSPMAGFSRVMKAVEDRFLALVITVLIAPLLVIIACAVKWTSPGPILFRQRRLGWDGREIVVYKFRTMKVHEEPAGTVTQATRDDARFTPIGGFLRRTSLDELPQFINVLQGRMSIVGPRPHALAHNEQYQSLIRGYMLRHKVKPGITGWAQVNDLRGATETVEQMQARITLDLHYIEHWSLAFDLKIILRTIAMVVLGQGNAY